MKKLAIESVMGSGITDPTAKRIIVLTNYSFVCVFFCTYYIPICIFL